MTKTILALGNSNCLGNQVGGAFIIDPLVTAWNNLNGQDDLLNVGTAWVAADVDAAPFDGSNCMMAHAASLMAAVSGEAHRLLLSARAGTIVNRWISLAGVAQLQYDRFEAIAAAAAITAFDYLFTHVGESEVLEGIEGDYAEAFGVLLARLEADGYITSSTPVVMGLMGPNWVALNPIVEAIAATSERVRVAYIDALPTFEGTHYIGSAMPVAGRRIVEALSGADAALGPVWG